MLFEEGINSVMPAKYSRKPENPTKSVYAKASMLRVHFKNTREAAAAIKGMSLRRAQKYLQDVIEKKTAVPFRRYKYGIGRHSQVNAFLKQHHTSIGRFPKKSCEYLLDLLRNAESNAEFKSLDAEQLRVFHIQVNKAPKMRRRTYRAHGRINPYMSNPCHIEIILTETEEPVAKPADKKKPAEEEVKKLTNQ